MSYVTRSKAILTYRASNAADANIGTGADALLTSMTITPVQGTYELAFDTTVTVATAGGVVSGSIYVGGTQLGDTLRKIAPFDGGALSQTSARAMLVLGDNNIVVDGTQAIEIRCSSSSGTAVAGPRSMRLRKL